MRLNRKADDRCPVILGQRPVSLSAGSTSAAASSNVVVGCTGAPSPAAFPDRYNAFPVATIGAIIRTGATASAGCIARLAELVSQERIR